MLTLNTITTPAEYLAFDVAKHITGFIRNKLKLNAYLAGGMVRECLLDNPHPKDMDIFVSINNTSSFGSIENHCLNLLNVEFKDGIIKSGKVTECGDFYLRGNYIGDDFNFFVYETQIKYQPFIYNSTTFDWIPLQIIFVNNSKYKSLLDVLRSFDIWLCRCAIDVNNEVVVLPECQYDIDNKTVTLEKDAVEMKSGHMNIFTSIKKAKNRQARFCNQYNFKPVTVNYFPKKFK